MNDKSQTWMSCTTLLEVTTKQSIRAFHHLVMKTNLTSLGTSISTPCMSLVSNSSPLSPKRVDFIQVSHLNASLDSTSEFCRSKAEGEIAVTEAFPDATIV